MAERRPEPRASLVDSGWSEPPGRKQEPSPETDPPTQKIELPVAAPPAAAPSADSVVPRSDKFEEDTRVDPPIGAVPTPDLPPPPPLPWQKPEPQRELPKYEESPRELQETRVDDHVQARARAMTVDPHGERTVVTVPQPSEHEIIALEGGESPPAVPTSPALPSPPIAAPPPALPVAAAPAPAAPPLPIVPQHARPETQASRPPLPIVPQAAPGSAPRASKPPLPIVPQGRPSGPPLPIVPQAAPGSAPRASKPPLPIVPLTAPAPAPLPAEPPAPPAHRPVSPEPVTQVDLVAPVAPAPRPASPPRDAVPAGVPPSLGSAVPPFPSPITVVDDLSSAPPLLEALFGRVRVAGRPVSLWVVVAGVLLATAMAAALLAFAIGGSREAPTADAASPSGEAPPVEPVPSSAAAEAPREGSPAESAPPVDRSALAALEKKPVTELGTKDSVALFNGQAAAALAEAQALRGRLSADPGLAKDPKIVAELLKKAHARGATAEVLSAMAALPGPLSADLLYEVWTGTPERTDATELARAIVLGKDVRPKASPALSVALDLREAESCEQNKAALERAVDVGDKRALVPITRLSRRTGCGANKRQDCYPCLREGDLIKKAFTAVRQRREPVILPK